MINNIDKMVRQKSSSIFHSSFIIVLYLTSFFLTSCEVDFSPNAEWKDIPVIYCLIDQDDDTTYARVQRCFLPEGNIYDYGRLSDSLHYPQGSISVALLAYEGNTLRDSIPFKDTLAIRDSGGFAYGLQPIFFAPTRGRLNENYSYVLSVRRTSDRSIVATTQPIKLIRQTSENIISKPIVTVINMTDTVGGGFAFYDEYNGVRDRCHIKWNALSGARLYQPVVRLYYEVGGVTRYVDAICPAVSSRSNELYYSQGDFLETVKNKLQDDPTAKRYLKRVDLYLHCCSEELSNFLENNAQATSLDFTGQYYTNVIGGEGVFAARRTHLYKRMPSDDSIVEGRGLYFFLKELGVGFY